jgi:hypothetical protein
MSKRTKRFNILKLLADLQKNGEAPPGDVSEVELDPQLALLQRWQLDRLSATYADFLADARYQPACSFFMDEIYAPRDFSRRDREFEHLYAMLVKFLPEWMLRLMRDAIELNQMTGELDSHLLDVLVGELGMQDQLSAEVYAEAYRRCDNYFQRLQQIEMLVEIVRQVGQGAQLPLTGRALSLARLPALKLGWSELYGFVTRGYQAFQPIKDVQPLAEVIEAREKQLLDQIYSVGQDLKGRSPQ